MRHTQKNPAYFDTNVSFVFCTSVNLASVSESMVIFKYFSLVIIWLVVPPKKVYESKKV